MDIETSALFRPIPTIDGAVESCFAPPSQRSFTGAQHGFKTDARTRGDEGILQDGQASDCGWGTLMVAAQHGDASSYRRLLNLLRPWFECYYRARLPMAMVEEAVQDALIVVHDKRHTYDAARPFEPWLAAIADYKLIDRLQAMKRVRPVSAEKTAVRKTRFGETPITGLGASSLSAEAIGLPFAGASMMLLRLIGLMVRRRPVSTR